MRMPVVRSQIRSLPLRSFSTVSGSSQPTIVFVGREGPSSTNPLLGPSDKKFPLPGNVSHRSLYEVSSQLGIGPRLVPNSQLQEILNPHPIKIDVSFREKVMEELLLTRRDQSYDVELTAQDCPKLLKKDLKHLFPNINMDSMPVSVLNLVHKTKQNMAAWSHEMEEERDTLTASFISSALAITDALNSEGYWADFVDPASGRPYLGKYSNFTLFETDEVYQRMGFQLEDLGCCKVLKHSKWGTHAFVGTIFTNASSESSCIKDVLARVNNDGQQSD